VKKEKIIKKALISGITGMDGSHMADLLLSKGYEVYGISRSSLLSSENTSHLHEAVESFEIDIRDIESIKMVVAKTKPDEIYNFASQSSVSESWKSPIITHEINATGTLNFLEVIRMTNENIKFFQASSSEMFGNKQNLKIHDEITPFWPKNPYASSKLYAHWITKNYRDAYGIFCCCGILFNHESERRGKKFVSRKITSEVAKIHLGLSSSFSLGNINIERDWGYAKDYVEGIWRMLQQERKEFFSGKNGEFVLASGKTRSIKDFLDEAFSVIGIADWSDYVEYDDKLVRPDDTHALCGDPKKIKDILGWQPETSFEEMVKKMVENDIKILGEENDI
tara:strand:- start:146 stop:1159 length:1014 start_codon:yes stop_codon:yes gene_type:complete